MSSPRMTTLSSSSIALRKPMFRALPRVTVCIGATSVHPRSIRTGRLVEAGQVLEELRLLALGLGVRLRVDMTEDPLGFRFGHGHAERPEALGQVVGLGLDIVEERLAQRFRALCV